MEREIKTPQTHPDHHTVGHRFRAWDGKTYLCDSYEVGLGYWMTDEADAANRRNVSERAIGRTFHYIAFDQLAYVVYESVRHRVGTVFCHALVAGGTQLISPDIRSPSAHPHAGVGGWQHSRPSHQTCGC